MMVVGTKPVPMMATVEDAVPTYAMEGVIAVTVGAGLVTCRLTGVPEPLVEVPFNAITENVPPLAS
jgi:hypothetical protein